MFKEVLRTEIVKNSVLFGGLRLFQKDSWRCTKKRKELNKLSRQLQNMMQLHMETDRLVVGVPMANYEIILMELDSQDPGKYFHQVVKIVESNEGHFVKVAKIAA